MRQHLKSAGAAAGGEPLGAPEFAALINPLLPSRPACVALAVSGGPDSMALACCMQVWAKKSNMDLLALIVDHGLRAESSKEAAQVRKNLAALKIAAEILAWEHKPIVTCLHDTARKARYRLLTEACRHHGIRHLLLAHQMEDQAETILMRLAKGSGINGLAGMAESSAMDGITLVRPFLAIPKARLIATCAAADVPYVNDPGNASPAFARGRLRRVMTALEAEGLTLERLTDLGARASDAKAALDHYTAALLRVATKTDAAGVVSFNLEQMRAAPRAIAERALVACLQAVHAEDYAPEHAALSRLIAALCRDGEMPVRTLHGCMIGKSVSHAIITRELASITDSIPLRAGESVIWDQRWRVTLAKNAGKHTWIIKPLGNPPHDVIDKLAPVLRRAVPQGRARAALPALWREDRLDIIPSLTPGAGNAEARLLTPGPVHIQGLASV